VKTTRSDLELMNKLLEFDDLSRGALEAFERWRDELHEGKRRLLTPKQRDWVELELDKRAPTYKNLVSAGKVPIGRPVIMPDCLRPENLPKKPPRRIAS
jgi:hypothetical protein